MLSFVTKCGSAYRPPVLLARPGSIFHASYNDQISMTSLTNDSPLKMAVTLTVLLYGEKNHKAERKKG